MLLSVICWLVCLPLDAQEKPASAPKPPYVKVPPSGTTWTVEIRTQKTGHGSQEAAKVESDSARSKVSMPVRVRSWYGTNQVQRVETTFSDGHTEEYYAVKGVQLMKYDGSNKVAALSEIPHFPGLDWLNGNGTYVGLETVGKIPCHSFKVTPGFLQSIPLPPETKYLAWINTETKFPVQAQLDEVFYRFSAVTPWPDKVELPREYQSALEKVQAQQRALEVMRDINRGK